MKQKYNGFVVYNAEIPPMKRITTDGKGSIPNALLGLYTSFGSACKVIDLYLKSREAKISAKTE